jgi:hypothetical protein
MSVGRAVGRAGLQSAKRFVHNLSRSLGVILTRTHSIPSLLLTHAHALSLSISLSLSLFQEARELLAPYAPTTRYLSLPPSLPPSLPLSFSLSLSIYPLSLSILPLLRLSCLSLSLLYPSPPFLPPYTLTRSLSYLFLSPSVSCSLACSLADSRCSPLTSLPSLPLPLSISRSFSLARPPLCLISLIHQMRS